MVPYWAIFSLWSLITVQFARQNKGATRLPLFVAAAVLTALMIGLRFEVGGDWGAYIRIYKSIYFLSASDSFQVTDPGYAFLNWASAQAGFGIGPVNLICSALFMAGFARLAWQQPNPALAILVAVPYLIIVVAMGYTRQAAAIGIICFAVAGGSERRIIRIVVLIGIAALFHKTAILVLPIILVPVFRRNIFLGSFGVFLFILLFLLLLRDRSDEMITNYVSSGYDSQGALVRVMMNVLAAGIFLVFRKRIDIPPFQKSFWTFCSILSVLSVVALAAAAGSAGVDRMSLYFIPLQSVVYARIPYVLGHGKAPPSALIGVLGYSFLVQFVWLNFADNAHYWLPYSIGL